MLPPLGRAGVGSHLLPILATGISLAPCSMPLAPSFPLPSGGLGWVLGVSYSSGLSSSMTRLSMMKFWRSMVFLPM